MRVTPDSALLQALSRFQEGQKAADRARFEDALSGRAPQTATDSASRASASRQISATVKSEVVTERAPPERGSSEGSRFAREAPNGKRPQFIAKGQTLNLLV